MARRIAFKIEVILRTSPTVVYQFLTQPECLVMWFCDEVHSTENEYLFYWNDSPEAATVLWDSEDELLRLQWEDGHPDEYFEYHITKSPITEETVLTITDFAELHGVADAKKLWESQIKQLKNAMGI
jgi:uncharacterized protein YndB with AHSA1/START domain